MKSKSESFGVDHEDASLMQATTRERPILFSGEMVRAILDGRKTQTRRVLGFQPLEILTPRGKTEKALKQVTRDWNGTRTWFSLTERGVTIADNHGVAFRCKYGEVGDRLWVRESHYVWSAGDINGSGRRIAYRATEPDSPNTWTPSIHMPRWASRITLEITGVRVERVQSIGHDDARAEGVEHDTGVTSDGPVAIYRRLWDSLNEKRGYSWDSNPWVWVIEFRRLAALQSIGAATGDTER